MTSAFSHGRLYPGLREKEDHWIFLESLTSLWVKVQLFNTLFLWVSQKNFLTELLPSLSVEKSQKGTCQKVEEKLSRSLFLPGGGFFNNHVTVSGCLWGSWRQNSRCSRVCLKPFIDEVHGQNEILFLPDPQLQVLITHFKMEPYSTSSTSRMCHKKQNPPQVPKLRPVEDFWGILKGLVCKGC